MVNIEAFYPYQVDIIKHLSTVDNLFRSLKGDEEKHRMQLNGIKEIMRKLRSKNTMQVQIATGLTEIVSPTIRKQLIDNTSRSFNAANDKYKGIVEQVRHRSDEVGESRIRMFKMLGEVLKRQHGLSVEDLSGYLVEKQAVQAKRLPVDFDVDIKKAVEASKNG